ncbi:MAG TPA: cytochrome c [Gemmatimonadaceae bacterium]|nr:cytochrome c [Gemmatimonadaceae bacterium]
MRAPVLRRRDVADLRRSVHPVALIATVLLTTLTACSREHGTVAPTFERMLVQPRYEPYGASSFFPDGRAMRLPPSGTVSREQLADSALVPASVPATTGADSTEAMPLQVTDELLAIGQSRFGIYCAVCHGTLADGNSVVGSNMVQCAPPSLLSARVRAMPPTALYNVIANGLGRMPAYAPELPVKQRWAVVAYVRQLQSRAPPDTIAAPPKGPGCGSRL